MPRTNKFKLSIGSSQYNVNIIERAYGLYDVRVNDETFKISIADMLSPLKTAAPAGAVPGSGGAGAVGTTSPSASASASASTGAGAIKAAMPGTVMTLKMKVGDAVKVGDILLTLETMKMENPIKSSRAGTIKEINVQPGKFVNVGDMLVVIE